MDSPFGQLLAEINTNKLNTEIIQLDPFCHYVSDTFIICHSIRILNIRLRTFALAHLSITFTMETDEKVNWNFWMYSWEGEEMGR